ncbi:N-acetylmuramoyl-L-alanine amidase [Lacticaseibacillus mingshuiensis]|uniref:N-acetylmuramoyl-L-alanine amidase n=1 Tax=Lacticaseibacillus mingshuiensis TaxID=2799574 RepID=A0ABW4CCY6_9LACO|nr:N-acetylmuramoyl-L-alanine amidase [Lacticaseibacillus mingshuiensis]
MRFKQLKKWPLIVLFSLLVAISAATTTVLANNQTLTVRASVLNVRLGPGLGYSVMGQVQNGTQLTVIDKENSWYQVRLAGNRIGWVASWLVDQNEATTTTARVATVAGQVNVRQYATTTSKVLGTLEPGDSAKVIYQEGDWTEIAYQNTAAWVYTKLINITNQTVTLEAPKQSAAVATKAAVTVVKATTTTAANVREAAGINAPIVTRLTKGQSVTILKQSGEWYYVQTATGKKGYIASWILSMPGSATAKAATSLSEATIVLDPGHGGTDSGAQSTSGGSEKTYTLALANKVGAALKAQGVNVIYTRSDDSFVDLAPRPAVAEKVHADAFISFHFDSTPNANTASGFTTYYYSVKKDKTLATYLNKSFTGLGLTNRGVEFGDFEVIRENTQPAVLLEMGYINDDSDYAKIKSAAYQQQIASDIVSGLTSYFKAGNHQ